MSRRLALLLGLALIGSGVALLGSFALDRVREDRATAAAQERLIAEVPAPGAPAPRSGVPVAEPVDRGEALAVMRIPRFGDDWRWAVVEGTALAQLDQGPGHYVGTALPGARGNAAFAAHRAGHGNPFLDFGDLRPGDLVELTQGETTWTYELTTSPRIVEADATEVIGDRPGRALTLTTCWPKWGSEKRMVVHGTLVG